MALKATIASGNFTTAGTRGVVDATSYLGAETGSEILTTAYSGTRSSAFTPGAITISHIGVKLSVRTGTTGTMSVELAQAGVGVAGTEVTINCSDLPVAATADLNGGWIMLKLATPVTLTAATAYTIEAKTSSSSQVSLFRDGTADNISRILVTTTTGAPAAGDDFITVKEFTGAGTSNTFTVTMDETATTDYGSAPTAANSLLTPGWAIGVGGTVSVGTTAATNYNLKMSNSIVVYSGGTFNMGTVGTAMPRDSSFVLQFDPGTNVDYGLIVRNLGTWTSQGLSRTSGKDIYYCKLNTDEAIASTSLGVDTDTGWLDNDEIVVASTTQTQGQTERGALNGAAGASTLTVDGFAGAGGGLAFAHSGTAPTQAEVMLLTRNVIIKGASASLQTYVDIKTTATVDCDWTQFKWMGSATANKRGVDVATTSGSASFQYCAFIDFRVSNSRGVNVPNGSSNNITCSNNCFYDIINNHVSFGSTSGVYTINANLFGNTSSVDAGSGIAVFSDLGSTVTNNIVFGVSSGVAFVMNSSESMTGDFSGNVVHSSTGYAFQSNILGGTMGSTAGNTARRNSSGFSFNSSPTCIQNITIKDMVMFGNSTSNISMQSGSAFNVTWDGLVSNGDTTFSTTTGMTFGGPQLTTIVNLINCDFSTVTGIKTAHTNDMSITSGSPVMISCSNCKFGGTNEVASQNNMSEGSFISSQKHDQTAGLHKTWKKYGTITIDTGTVHTGSQSIKMTPNNASNKLDSSGAKGGFIVAVANGATVTPTVYVYEDASYNGNRARLIVKRNSALGITSDTVLDTATAASDAAWEGLTGTTAAVTDDGVLEFVVDCNGTAGNLFVDSFTVA